jgi:hypothetical protein
MSKPFDTATATREELIRRIENQRTNIRELEALNRKAVGAFTEQRLRQMSAPGGRPHRKWAP